MMDRPERTWLDPRIEVRPSPIHGIGMFATATFKEGEVVLIWADSYTDRAGAEQAMAEGKGTMQWDEDVFSVETEVYPEAYAINHSCDPNAWMLDAYTVVARRYIAEGEEVMIDIAMFEADEGSVCPWECNCGSSICRGVVTGKDWRDPVLQERYRGHFSPLVNMRIADL